MTWRVPAGWPHAPRTVQAPARQGMAIARVGEVTATITLTSITTGQRWARLSLPVGIASSAASTVPALAPPPLAATTAQDGVWGQGQSGINVGRGRNTITAICYGPAALRFYRPGNLGPDLPMGRVPCDDQPHSLTYTGPATEIFWNSAPLTAWRVQIARP